MCFCNKISLKKESMVEASAQNLILVANPTTVRGHRTSFDVSPTHFFYPAKDNLVAKSRTADSTQSAVWCLNRDRITCVALAHDGSKVAFGDEKGKVVVLKWKDNKFEAHKEHFLLSGLVNEILWSADDKCIVALGENKGQLAACNPESGSRMGDVTGFTSTVLCGVLTSEKVLYSAGEGNELLKHQGIPFKG